MSAGAPYELMTVSILTRKIDDRQDVRCLSYVYTWRIFGSHVVVQDGKPCLPRIGSLRLLNCAAVEVEVCESKSACDDGEYETFR